MIQTSAKDQSDWGNLGLLIFSHQRKRKISDLVIWQKPLHPQTNPKSNMTTQKNVTENFNYTTIADRLRTVSWVNDSHPTGVVKPVNERSTFPLTATAV